MEEVKDWLGWAMEMAKPWGLQEDVKESYKKNIALGYSEKQSAYDALYEWDI